MEVKYILKQTYSRITQVIILNLETIHHSFLLLFYGFLTNVYKVHLKIFAFEIIIEYILGKFIICCVLLLKNFCF